MDDLNTLTFPHGYHHLAIISPAGTFILPEQDMACLLWTRARELILWISVASLLQASPSSGIYVDFAASIPSGAVYTGIPVELIATLKVTSLDGMNRDTLIHQRGFNPQVHWKTQIGSFKRFTADAVLGENTRPPNGLVFVSKSTYIPPSLPGEYTITAFPEADTSKAVSLKVMVEDLSLKLQPSAVTLAPGQEQPFVATFRGPLGTPLLWSTTGGSVSPLGLFKAPIDPGIHTITVQHLPSGTRASALVTVANAFSIQPTSLDLAPRQTAQFRYSKDQGYVSWSVQEPGGGTIEPDGLYTAHRAPGTGHLLGSGGSKFSGLQKSHSHRACHPSLTLDLPFNYHPWDRPTNPVQGGNQLGDMHLEGD